MIRAFFASFTFVVASFAGPIGFQVTIDTSTIAGQSGFLDLQFNPGGWTRYPPKRWSQP